jgi:hypothetical protein
LDLKGNSACKKAAKLWTHLFKPSSASTSSLPCSKSHSKLFVAVAAALAESCVVKRDRFYAIFGKKLA